MTCKANDYPSAYRKISYTLGVYNIFMVICVFVFLFMNMASGGESLTSPSLLLVLVIVNILCYAVPVLINGSTCKIIKGLLAGLFFTPSYMNTFVIYAFCNFDDTSWGTKGLTSNTELGRRNLEEEKKRL